MKRFLMTLAFLLPLNTSALTPGEVQAIVQHAQESVQTLPQTKEEDVAIAIVVSLSMPKASLLKLGQDARDAGLSLTFRGVSTEIENKPDEKPQTVAQRYGKGLIARHMEDFKFLTDAGANVQLDPVLFARHQITDVPRVMVVPVCRTACERNRAVLVAKGDVSLRYVLDALFKDGSEKLKTNPQNLQLKKALQLIENALDRLGDRP